MEEVTSVGNGLTLTSIVPVPLQPKEIPSMTYVVFIVGVALTFDPTVTFNPSEGFQLNMPVFPPEPNALSIVDWPWQIVTLGLTEGGLHFPYFAMKISSKPVEIKFAPPPLGLKSDVSSKKPVIYIYYQLNLH